MFSSIAYYIKKVKTTEVFINSVNFELSSVLVPTNNRKIQNCLNFSL